MTLQQMRFKHENGAPWHLNTTYRAVWHGHLECLRYAHENGAPWHPETTSSAAEGGHLECLRYAHENGAPWHPETTRRAAANGFRDCLEYAIARKRVFDDIDAPLRTDLVRELVARHHACLVIGDAWRARRLRIRRAAVKIIEDAYLRWAMRPPPSARIVDSADTNGADHGGRIYRLAEMEWCGNLTIV